MVTTKQPFVGSADSKLYRLDLHEVHESDLKCEDDLKFYELFVTR